MRIFISYASVQRELAMQICSFLEAQGKQCWIAPRDVPPGTNYGEEIIKGLDECDGVLLVYDKAANESQHVLREVERAVSKSLPIVVYRVEDVMPTKAMEYFLYSIQWLDAKEGGEVSLQEIDRALNDRVADATEKKKAAEKETAEPAPEKKKWLLPVAAAAVVLLLGIAVTALNFGERKKETEEPTPTTTVAATKQPDPTEAVVKNTEFRTGDYVSFGSYIPGGENATAGNGEIEWQVVEVADGSIVLVSTRILAIRPYDCAESGVYNQDNAGEVYDRNKAAEYTPQQMMEFRGSNQWETSDLCCWLNGVGVVQYPGKVPQNRATDEHGNAYGAEAGFLTDFTKKEQEMVKNSGFGVFLLTTEQAVKYAGEGTLRLETTPTEAAIAADETSWYKSYKASGATNYIWATSTAVDGSACKIYHVNTTLSEEVFGTLSAASAGFGVRPAIRIFPEGVAFTGDGSRQAPYRLAE